MMRFWVADMGGTNCRLAEFVCEKNPALVKEVWLATQSFQGAQDLLEAFATAFPEHLEDVRGLCLALAGPVTPEGGRLTNASFVCDRKALHTALSALLPKAAPSPEILVINDFVAQAYAVLSPLGEQARPLRSRQKAWPACGVRAVIGAGTGLGAALLIERAGQVTVCASEAGHQPFPFRRDEYDCARFLALERGLPEPTCEDLLSGPGLCHLHAYVTGEELAAPEIGQRYLHTSSPTLELFSRFYGRFCRIWLYTTCCYDGLWIGGGIALANPLTVQSPAFLAEIEGTGVYAWVSDIPLWLFPSSSSGLWGACWALWLRQACCG